MRRVKAKRGRPGSKVADFHSGNAAALDGTPVVITSVVKHVGTVMSDFADYLDGRNIIRPVEEIANGCDLDRATVMRAIETLCQIGMLWRGYRGSSSGLKNKCSEYQLVIADDLLQRVPLHPPTERNDQVTPTRLAVENAPASGVDQVTPTRIPGESESPAQVSRSHPSYPVTNPVPTHSENSGFTTAEVEGGQQRAKCRKCHKLLDPVVAADGIHPTCDDASYTDKRKAARKSGRHRSSPRPDVQRCQHGYPVAVDGSTTCAECDYPPEAASA